MKRFLLAIVSAMLVCASLFAATEQAWYNDVTSIANNGQYYIYNLEYEKFIQANDDALKTATKTVTPSCWTITNASNGNVKCIVGNTTYYINAYTNALTGSSSTRNTSNSVKGCDLTWVKKSSYWLVYGTYNYLGTKTAYLFYTGSRYNANQFEPSSDDASWYLVSTDQYTRHWLIYDFDVLKESINLSSYATTVYKDLYAALATAMTPTFDVKTSPTANVQTALTALQTAKNAADAYPGLYATAVSDFTIARNTAQTYLASQVPDAVYALLRAYDAFTPDVVNTPLTDIEAATTALNDAIAKAEDTKTVYAASLAKITALADVADKGDGDLTLITTDIANATSAIETATSAAAVTAAVAGLRQIDMVTALNTSFDALQTLSAVAQSQSGLALTYTSQDLTTVDASLQALKSGTCVIEAATAGDATYYPFMRLVTVTIAKIDPVVSVSAADIIYPATVHTSNLVNSGTPGQATWLEPDAKRLPGVYPGLAVHFTPLNTGAYNEVNTTVTLTVLAPTTYGEANGGTCPGSTYYYAGHYYAPGTHTVHLRNYLGGDSIVTLHVTEYPTYNKTIQSTIYSDQTLLWNCKTYTEGGTYTATYQTVHGCDSVVTLILNVLPRTTYGNVYGTICTGESFVYNGKSYTTAGIYIDHLVNHFGGDSVVTITVTEYPTYTHTRNVTICGGQTFLWDCNTYTEAGSYTRHYQSVHGCDSTVTLNLNILPSYTINETLTIGVGWAETWHGQDLSTYASGAYLLYDSLTSSEGCDSVYVLNLTVVSDAPTTYGYDSAYICPGEPYTYRDSLMTDSGAYVFKLHNAQWGDSILTFYLRYWPTYKKKSNRVIHQGINYKWRGRQLSGYDEGYYVLWDSLTTVHGCDSLFYCTLTILPPETQYYDLYPTVCPGDTFRFEDLQFTDSGLHEILVPEKSRYRGDSVVRVHLAFYPTYWLNKRRIMYQGQSVIWHGTDLSTFPVCDTLLYDSLQTYQGCDSIFCLHLTVMEVPTTYQFDTVRLCGLDSIHYCRDTVIKTPGDYVFFLTNFLGGDSILSLHVDWYPTYYHPTYDTVTQGDPVYWRGQELYFLPYDHYLVDTLLSSHGCDSIEALFVHVEPKHYIFYDTLVVCQNAQRTWRGKVLDTDTAGYFPAALADTFPTAFDADSIRILNLFVNAAPVIDFYYTWREGHPKTWYREHFSGLTPGFYTFSSGRLLHTSQGCDSVEVMHLAVVPTIKVAMEANLCPGQSVEVGGKTFSHKGVYTVTTSYVYHGYDSLNLDSLGFAGTTFYGDSIITLTVYERPTYDLHIEKHLSYGDVLIWRGEEIPMEDVGVRMYYDTTVSRYDCDSITVLTVYVDRAQQTIIWHPDTLSVHAGDSIRLHAYASSGLPVTFTSSSLFYAFVNQDNWLIGRVMGRATITASQNGNAYYYAAQPVQYNFDILEPLPYDALDAVRPDDLDALPEGASPVKVIRHGHLYILTPEGIFDASGRKVE